MKNGLTIDKSGNKEWWLNYKRHRVDGPAIEYIDGTKSWLLNGKYHRVDGPAIEDKYGVVSWYLNGIMLNEKQIKTFKKILSCPTVDLPLFMGDETFTSVIENRFRKETIRREK